MNNIVVCAYGTGVGGMEVFFSEYIKYLVKNKFNVFLLTINEPQNIYFKLLDGFKGFTYIYRNSDNIMYMSEKAREKQRMDLYAQIKIDDPDNTYGVGGYFRDLLILMNLFRGTNTKLLLIWPHPLDWANYIPYKQKQYYFKKNKNSLYKYQKFLLKILDELHASYYTSYAIFDYNRWYYEIDLPDREIEGLPIQANSGAHFKYNSKKEKKDWNILWVGRFDYYKNDAIFKIFKTLEEISKERGIKISFNIVGHGSKEYVADLKKRIVPQIIKVNYLGSVLPSELNMAFSKNDIGIGMGVTVKQMGYAGLPAILIDSLSKRYKGENVCSWVFDIDTGDDGDGLYYQVINKPLKNRRPIYCLLNEVFDNPEILNDYSERCQKSITQKYSYDRQYHIITDRLLTSKFCSKNIDIYRYGFLRVCLRKIIKLVRNVK